jgi:hypothetical protein
LSRIDIPDTGAKNPQFGGPGNSKCWKGPWKSVIDPDGIAKVISEVNSNQYHQAHGTPFGSGPLVEKLGRQGDTQIAYGILQGFVPQLDEETLLPETIRIIHTLAKHTPRAPGTAVILADNFINSYKKSLENTSSSPSGRHIGHYKAVTKDHTLTQLHADMMTIPFQAGFVPPRWTKVMDIMLEKEENNPRCYRLHFLLCLSQTLIM